MAGRLLTLVLCAAAACCARGQEASLAAARGDAASRAQQRIAAGGGSVRAAGADVAPQAGASDSNGTTTALSQGDPLAGQPRVDSGALPDTAATCSFAPSSQPGGGASLPGGGARTRVFVYNTAGGTRDFFVALPSAFDAPPRAPLPLLVALHGGGAWAPTFLTGAPHRRGAYACQP